MITVPQTIQTREYQIRVIENTLAALLQGHTHILIELPTGAGKTVTALMLAKHLNETMGYTTGWCTIRRHLLIQAADENRAKIGLKSIEFFSIFEKNPPKVDLLIMDECLPGNTKLLIIHNGVVILATLLDVMGGMGTHVLSADSAGYIFQPIVSRFDMGVRELYEAETDETKLLITGNGRILANGEFVRADNIARDAVCCQTYNNTQRTAYGNRIETTILEKMPSQSASQENKVSPTLCVRVWPKGVVEFRKVLLQQVLVQPSSSTSQGCVANSTARSDCQRDVTGGWEPTIAQEQNWEGLRIGQASNPSLDEKTVGLCQLVVPRAAESDYLPTQGVTECWIWKGVNSVQYMFNEAIIPDRQDAVYTSQDCHDGIPTDNRRVGSGYMVDGRWKSPDISNSFVYNSRTRCHYKMVPEPLGDRSHDGNGSPRQQTIFEIPGTTQLQSTPNHFQICAPDSLVQIWTSPCIPVSGQIRNIKRSCEFARTYDIEVANTHCFFANGVLVHNCQHVACESAVTIIGKINPKIELGLTATPYRTDKAKLMYSKVIKDAGIRALIDQGYLAPFHQYTFDKPWTPEHVADVYLRDRERWGKTVGYFLTRDECEACASLIRAAGTPCEVVWAGSDQEQQIHDFKVGAVPILLNIILLTEGFNDPTLKTVFVRPGSRGPTIQMTGRALRPKPYAQVVQNNETDWPFTRTASCAQKFALNLQQQWENRSQVSTLVAEASKRVISTIPNIQVAMPAYIAAHRKKTRVFQ